ncbi:hypothetical protein [Microvirga sp. VF16]|uniref:hypothetical protein n=1 Tax=Microvirga sp. VF16 TaxID=2807101 RepID=UPI00193CD1FC|nr:hypothetical protein [Microvirga sp. VF16]QRM35398.1 hypothetical protein JO965_44375 [Microvirga sp. VF16]
MTTRKRTDPSASDESSSFDHGALDIVRVPPEEQGPGFLKMLQANGTVMPVDEGWTQKQGLPPYIEWVLFPNGDLARVSSS